VGSRLYSRKGDEGETSIAGGERVRKNSLRVETYGTIDEANALVGLARASASRDLPDDGLLDEVLEYVQRRLSDCARILATPPDGGHTDSISDETTFRLEGWIDQMEAATGPTTDFILPGGCDTAARLHVARTVVRRAERRMLDLHDVERIDLGTRAFVNRLSDLLFAAARYANKVAGVTEAPQEHI